MELLQNPLSYPKNFINHDKRDNASSFNFHIFYIVYDQIQHL